MGQSSKHDSKGVRNIGRSLKWWRMQDRSRTVATLGGLGSIVYICSLRKPVDARGESAAKIGDNVVGPRSATTLRPASDNIRQPRIEEKRYATEPYREVSEINSCALF